MLTYDRLFEVERIGKQIHEDEASAEFIGIVMLSKKGAAVFKEQYKKALVEYSNKYFYEAENIYKASLEDFLQYLIDCGYEVNAMQVNSGWMEIHTFENYKHACSIAL